MANRQDINECYLEIGDFYDYFNNSLVDPSSITLEECDIDDEAIHINTEKLSEYKSEFLKRWLAFRGDSLKGLVSLKDYQLKVMQYFKHGTDKDIIDPTSEKKWIKLKANKMGHILKPETHFSTHSKISCPSILESEILCPQNAHGWSKDIKNLPKITIREIEQYHKLVNESVSSISSVVKKPFSGGKPILEENSIDLDSIYSKENEEMICLKGLCSASLKKKDRWVFVALRKYENNIKFSFCQCPAGKVGTCSHSYAITKLICKWALEGLISIPEAKACTSRPCEWSVPQSRGRSKKPPISKLTFLSTGNKNSPNENSNPKRKGIKCTLYDARLQVDNEVQKERLAALLNINSNCHGAKIINPKPIHFVETLYGNMPVESILSNQCPVIPSGFQLYCNVEVESSNPNQFIDYPSFPFCNPAYVLQSFLENVSNQKELSILQNLKLQANDSVSIEKETTEQSNNSEWFEYRKFRFKASLCNKVGDFNKKTETEKGLKSLAHNIVFGNEKEVKNKYLQQKLSFGKYYEPIAIQMYQRLMKTRIIHVTVHEAGLAIDPGNFVLAATPDGKVFDGESFGILEVKCSEHYKNVDPYDICFISKEPCIVYVPDTNSIHINKKHSYYSQIQMQLAITSQAWCDFVLYTLKGMVIDRVYFDQGGLNKRSNNS